MVTVGGGLEAAAEGGPEPNELIGCLDVAVGLDKVELNGARMLIG